jgi:hypothetical protein
MGERKLNVAESLGIVCIVLFSLALLVGQCSTVKGAQAPPAKAQPVAPVSPPAKPPAGADTRATKPAPPAKGAPPALPAGSVLLTDAEAKDLHIAVLENQNLELRIQSLEAQVGQARAKVAADHDALTEKFAKAHNVDLAKFRLNPDLKAFVPVAPEKK